MFLLSSDSGRHNSNNNNNNLLNQIKKTFVDVLYIVWSQKIVWIFFGDNQAEIHPAPNVKVYTVIIAN